MFIAVCFILNFNEKIKIIIDIFRFKYEQKWHWWTSENSSFHNGRITELSLLQKLRLTITKIFRKAIEILRKGNINLIKFLIVGINNLVSIDKVIQKLKAFTGLRI